MRALFMQNKYGKADTSNSENKPVKTEDNNHMPSTSQTSNMSCASRIPQLPPSRKDEETKPSISTTNILLKKQDMVIPKPNTSSQEQLLEKLKSSQIQWQTPPGTFVMCLFSYFCFSSLNCFYLGGNLELFQSFSRILHYCDQWESLIKSDGLVRLCGSCHSIRFGLTTHMKMQVICFVDDLYYIRTLKSFDVRLCLCHKNCASNAEHHQM